MKLVTALIAILPAVASQTVQQMLQGIPTPGRRAPNNMIEPFRAAVVGNPAIARAWIRAAFHECGTFDQRNGGRGGNTGSLQFESTRAENRGLEGTIGFYQAQMKRFGISFADAVHIGGIVALEAVGGPTGLPMTIGRRDQTVADLSGFLPSDSSSITLLIGAMQTRMGFTREEMVALISGAHSVAIVHKANSPTLTPGPLDTTPDRFDSQIFNNLLSNNPAPGTTRLIADRNMALQPSLANIMRNFAANATSFNINFARAYYSMMNKGATFK